MLREDLILRTRLVPPRLHRHTLPRPALDARLREALDRRCTVVHAGTGYGKSTALAACVAQASDLAVAWYSLSEADTDPQRFLAYLIAAFRTRFTALSNLPQALLQDAGPGGEQRWDQVVDALSNALVDALSGPALLILDDYHFVSQTPAIAGLTERFIGNAPADLHVILATRQPLHSPAFTAWRARGELLEIDRSALAFQPDEIDTLFREAYGLALTAEESAALADRTEGWPIALQLVWQGMRSTGARSAAELLVRGQTSGSLTALFEFLANEVLGRQPPEVVDFLLDTAGLHELTPSACDAVTTRAGSAEAIVDLLDRDLFVVSLGDQHYRYHHLFHDFLRAQLATQPERARVRAERAGAFFEALGDPEEAFFHWITARRFVDAARVIERDGEAYLRRGQLDTVAGWVDALPAEVVAERPALHHLLGDLSRLRSRFEEALAWYQTAERAWRSQGDRVGIGRALRGQALVYLDTVRPAQAESLLEEALRLSDGLADREARARMLELLAENKLNMGKPDEAERLRVEARGLREEGPGEDALSVRVKVRTGRLAEAAQILTAWRGAERDAAALGQPHAPRAHRETVLLLSLIQSLVGHGDAAFALAQEGADLGERLGSPFVTAVAHIRLGHAWLVRARAGHDPRIARDSAIQAYHAAIALGDQLSVRRIRAEALWGLTLAHGLFGDGVAAEHAAAEGIGICRWAGDQWVGALTELAVGASVVREGRPAEATAILIRALQAFRDCGDTFGRAAARLWLSLAYHDLNAPDNFVTQTDDLLQVCEANGFDRLLTGPSLLGPPDPRRVIPILLAARSRGLRPAFVDRLLAEAGVPHIRTHPGYQLRVQTLGGFRAWRGTVEIDPREWQRDKARQLFQLLLTQRGRPLQRDEITERLWPNLAPDVASRDFKVALNVLNKVLEPGRSTETPSAFVIRDGTTYCLRPEADLWLDLTEFETTAEAGLNLIDGPEVDAHDKALTLLQTAIGLYTGDFLPEALYEGWAAHEQERLLALYLRAADRLAGLLLERGQAEETVVMCQRILARDACWERAYQMMMLAHRQLGNRPQALRVYQRCVAALRAELDVAPSPATVAVMEELSR